MTASRIPEVGESAQLAAGRVLVPMTHCVSVGDRSCVARHASIGAHPRRSLQVWSRRYFDGSGEYVSVSSQRDSERALSPGGGGVARCLMRSWPISPTVSGQGIEPAHRTSGSRRVDRERPSRRIWIPNSTSTRTTSSARGGQRTRRHRLSDGGLLPVWRSSSFPTIRIPATFAACCLPWRSPRSRRLSRGSPACDRLFGSSLAGDRARGNVPHRSSAGLHVLA